MRLPVLSLCATLIVAAVIIFTPSTASAWTGDVPDCETWQNHPLVDYSLRQVVPVNSYEAIDFNSPDTAYIKWRDTGDRSLILYSSMKNLKIGISGGENRIMTQSMSGAQLFQQSQQSDINRAPISYYQGGSFPQVSCIYDTHNIFYDAAYTDRQDFPVDKSNDEIKLANAAPTQGGGGSGSGGDSVSYDTLFAQQIGVVVALLIAGWIILQFRYRGTE